MPALPSFITSRKGKVTLKSTFALLRGEQSTPASLPAPTPAPTPPHPLASEVLDINDRSVRHYSLDFDGGQPIDEYETDIIDEELRNPRSNDTPTPQVQLDIDLSPEALTDWFAANFLHPENVRLPSEKQGTSIVGSMETLSSQSRSPLEGVDEAGVSTSSEDVLSNLQAMNASHFGKLPGSEFNRLDQASSSSKKPSTVLAIPAGSSQGTNNQESRSGAVSELKTLRPLSLMDTPVSSAVSGSTLARALLSNAFVLSNDNRISRFRTSTVGLTRSDSTTLPRGDHTIPSSFHDRFSVGPDAPPIPSNAGFLYEPPKKPRTPVEWREKKRQELKRRSSTGSLHPKVFPDTPTSSGRPNSALLSPGAEFDLNSLLKSPAFLQTPRTPPRSPLPPTPQYLKHVEEAKKTESAPIYQEVTATRPLPVGPQTPSSDFLNLLSPASSSDGLPSAKNMDSDDVLNYYSHPDSPEPLPNDGGYRPGVSPISEETSSQLSPPTPYKDRRESQRNIPIPLGARSPLSGGIRIRGESVTLPRKPSDTRPYSRQLLAPMGERPLSAVQPPSPSGSQTSSLTSASSDLLSPLAPPPSHIFNRQRSGSAPSPIMVVRDPKDATTYNITISPSNADSDTPTSEEAAVTQEFPETPSAFSPLITGGTDGPPFLHQSLDGHEVPPMLAAPTSATIPRGTQPSLAQQLLLNRAVTTVKHTRQTSIGKIKTSGLAVRSGSPSNRRIADISEDVETKVSPAAEPNGSLAARRISTAGSLPESPSNQAMAHEMSRSPSRGTVVTMSDGSSMYTSESSSKSRVKSLPPIPNPPIPSTPAASPVTTIESVNAPEFSTMVGGIPVISPTPTIPPPSPPLSQKAQAPPARGRLPPALNISSSNPAAEYSVAVNGNGTDSSDSPASSSRPASNPPVFTASSSAPAPASNTADHDQPSAIQTSSSQKDEGVYTGRASDIFRATSLGSPPPYYTVVNETPMQQAQVTPPVHHTHTPNGSFSNTGSFSFRDQAFGTPAGPSNLEWSDSLDGRSTLGRENSIAGQRSRMRPPLPQGPRRPSQQQMMMAGPSGQYHPSRDRSGSVSSVTSNPLLQAARVRSAPAFSPKFQTPPPKWRGYTMEAAKWTFTSAQLQAIVSRAIKQSAEASSIRLLRLDVLDTEIPDEIRRLGAQRTDLKTRYKVLTRRRATLLDALTAHMTGMEEDNSSYALRLLEEIREMVVTLDRLAEELHSLDGQLAHLDSLTHIHTGSALAMALRKLNASFLKQVAENQVLRNQIQSVEAERDEAWAQAEVVANEFDRMNDKIDSPSSKRSSRISAVRKSSVRVSKAGLRTPSQRLSQRSSLGSSLYGPTSSSRSPLPRLDKSPPVPPIPKHRPLQILTDSPLRSSAVLSTGGVTPNSGTRALAEAQDELYAMLGITNPDRGLRRSRSAAGLLLSPPPVTAGPSTLLNNRPSDVAPSRRSSLPGDSTLAEAYNAMAADRNAVLATIDMLSATD